MNEEKADEQKLTEQTRNHSSEQGAKPEKFVYSPDEIPAMGQDETRRVLGGKVWDITNLEYLVAQACREAGPPLTAHLPRLFLSYSRESSSHSSRVHRFATDLVERGYEVVFDQFAEVEPNPPTVPELISRMVTCNFFVPVLTPSYLGRIPHGSGRLDARWVFDEWRIAVNLSESFVERLKIFGIWRAGSQIPPPLTVEKSICDFRDDSKYQETLNRYFPQRPMIIRLIAIGEDGYQAEIGPMHRFEAARKLTELQKIHEFTQIAIVTSRG